MSNVSLVPFWLDVKKEYVIENFEKLIEYLGACSLHPDAIGSIDDESSDFNRTYNILRDVTYECASQLKDLKVYDTLDYKSESTVFKIRLLGTYLLASKLIDKSDYNILSILVKSIVATNFIKPQETLFSLQKVIYGCMRRAPLIRYGISWSDIKDFSVNGIATFCVKLGNTTFDTSINDECEYEGQGLLVLKNNNLYLSPLNRNKLKELEQRNKISTQFATPVLNVLNASRECVNIKDFATLKDRLRAVGIDQQNFIPSPIRKKEKYDYSYDTEDIIVKVTGKKTNSNNNVVLCAETLDPSYEKVKGEIYVKSNLHGISSSMLTERVSVGCFLKVRLQNHVEKPFILDKSFEKFYKEETLKCDNKMSAVYLERYSVGKRWLTNNGLTVNIRSTEDYDDIDEAVANKQIINIKVYERKNDKNNNPVINGSYDYPLFSDDHDDVTAEEFIDQAYETLLDNFIEYCYPNYEIKENETIRSFDVHHIEALECIAYHISKQISNSQKRYSALYTIMLIATTIKDEDTRGYMNVELQYLSALVDFARNTI